MSNHNQHLLPEGIWLD